MRDDGDDDDDDDNNASDGGNDGDENNKKACKLQKSFDWDSGNIFTGKIFSLVFSES